MYETKLEFTKEELISMLYKRITESQDFVKYLEKRIESINKLENPTQVSIGRRDEAKDILERFKSGNYK